SLKENLSNLVKSSRMALNDKSQRIAKLEKRINQLPGNEKQLLNYQRKSDLYENLYNYLSQELAKTGIARAEDIADTRVLDKARMVGDGPISPQKTLVMLLAFILGLTLPLAWIIFSEAFKETISSVDQLEGYTSLSFIGQIGRARQVHEHAINPVSDWMAAEAFRNIAAQLQFKVRDKEKNIIGISSMLPNEGKSFCATNLALSLATEGKKVLLIDLNFRKPDLFKESNQEEGILRYLRGDCALEEIICKHKQWSSLHYITCRANIDHPHQLLNSPQLLTMITAMKYEYDYLILDSPAVGLVSDYLLLSKHIDIHLFVLRRNQSKRSQIQDIEQLKREGDFEHLFLVFNDAQTNRSPSTYAYPKPGEAKKKNLMSRYWDGIKRPA
ncbi:MAG: GNVR domain-containing protein, partial [Bacteroidota bacterium]